jgi:phosphatidylinositol alpha-1,6-mannosyltransferase
MRSLRRWLPFSRSRRLRILWITSEYHPRVGGLEKLTEQMLAALGSSCDVGLITNLGQHPKPGEPVSHVGALDLKGCRTTKQFDSVRGELRHLAETFRPDAIHLASGGLACFADLLSDLAPIFCTVHCKDVTAPWQRVPGTDVKAAIAGGLARCARVFCVSDYTRGHVERLAPTAPAETLTPGLPAGSSSQRESRFTPEGGIPRILTVSRVAPRKGHHLLLEALKRVKHTFIWDVVGTGPLLEEVDARVEQSAIAGQTILHGAVDDGQLALLFGQCDLFALTPVEVREGDDVDAEGFGMVYLEAASYGKASIGSTLGGCAEAIADGSTGLAVDPRDTEALARAVELLLSSLELRRSMGRAARQRLLTEFRMEDRVTALMRHYESASEAARKLPSAPQVAVAD